MLDEHGQCGSGLARESSLSVCTCGTDPPLSRASPLPQKLGSHSKLCWMNTANVGLGLHSKLCWMNTVNVGAGLLANAVFQFAHVALTQRHRGQARSHRNWVYT